MVNSIGGMKMDTKKHIVVGFIVVLLLVSTILTSCGRGNMYSKKQFLNFSELIGNENIEDISLTIYYMSPYILTNIPLSVDSFTNSSSAKKIVINGSDLEEHINLFKQISNDDLIPIRKKSSYLDVRLYYVLESKKNGKLFDVAMWGGDGDENSIFVNEFEVKGNDIFYEAIIPFLPEDAAKEWTVFINSGEEGEDSSTL